MSFNIFFVFFISFFASAQRQDSLLRAAQKEKDPGKKADFYLKLVTFTAQNDAAKALSYLRQAEKLTPKNDKIGQAEIQNSWGYYYMPRDPAKGKEHHLKGIEILKDENSTEAQNLRAKLWFNVAAYHQRMGNNKEAMTVLLNNSIPEAKKATDKIYLANDYLTVCLIFYNDNNLDKALQYGELALQTLKGVKKSAQSLDLFATAQGILAETYMKKEDYPAVKKKIDIIDRFLKQNPNNSVLTQFLHLQSVYYSQTGDHRTSLAKANEGLKVTAETGNLYQIVRLTFMKSKAQSNLGQFEEASKTLQELLNNKVYVQNYMPNAATIYDELWMLEEKRGNYKGAMEFAKKRIRLSDSLNINSQNEAINEMETKFRTADKEKQLAVKELEINKKNQYMWAFLLTSLVLFGAGLFTYFYFRNKKKLGEQREINLQQQLKEKEQAEELNLTKAILDGEERERERVAKDLHDGLGGMLAGVKINLSTWSSNHLEENQYESFHKILNQLDSSVSELRRVARNLMPESLLNFGLEIALKDLCEFYMKDGLTIDFQAINIQKNLPLNLQVNIYRIVQELLNNAVKHSNADNILVQCSQNADEFYITVEDNGKGITEGEMKKVKSLGLKNLQNRIDFLKGKMEIQSFQNEGTIINIEVKTGAVA